MRRDNMKVICPPLPSVGVLLSPKRVVKGLVCLEQAVEREVLIVAGVPDGLGTTFVSRLLLKRPNSSNHRLHVATRVGDAHVADEIVVIACIAKSVRTK